MSEISIGLNQLALHEAIYNSDRRDVYYISAFGTETAIKFAATALNKSGSSIRFNYNNYQTMANRYNINISHLPNSDYCHLIAYLKDFSTDRDNEEQKMIYANIFFESDKVEDIYGLDMSDEKNKYIVDAIYDRLYSISPYPILKSWIPYLWRKFRENRSVFPVNRFAPSSENTESRVNMIRLEFYLSSLKEFISQGLKSKDIFIDENNNETSFVMSNVDSLDSYLNIFAGNLTEKIQDSFTPMFTPEKDDYAQKLIDISEYNDYAGCCKPYNAQMDVIQSCSNALDKNNIAFIVAETGTGKTLMSIDAVMTNSKRKRNMTNIVMCPGHLVNKWKSEIERLTPTAKAVIIENFSHLYSLREEMKNKNRLYPVWIIISKDTAKLGYSKRPSAEWKFMKAEDIPNGKWVYCCPKCGQPLYSIEYVGTGRRRRSYKAYFNEMAFSHMKGNNMRCMNKVKEYDPETGKYKEVPCGAELWTANGKYEKPVDFENKSDKERWLNLGEKVGWIRKDHIHKIYSELVKKTELSKDEIKILSVLQEADEGEIPSQVIPYKYPLGRYIRKYFKGCIDYAIMDEVHELKGKDTLQSIAFGDIISTAKKTLCLTGTLLNGYASGIFYILYRAFPRLMKKEGFSFNDCAEFSRQYGVTKSTQKYKVYNGRPGNKVGNDKDKELPGVSPIVFTKFLLENAVFVGLEDIGCGLPGYEEILEAVDMDEELKESYNKIEDDVRSSLARFHTTGMKIMSQLVNLLTVYPDQPYMQPPIIHPDTGEVIMQAKNLISDTLRNKDKRIIEIIKDKVAKKEKVLVYYNYTGRTNIGETLPELLKAEGIKAVTMKSSVAAKKREEWIQKQVKDKNIDVLICNPKLVETGLDLLDFTTIIFYQLGYNLFTMRQASRRSWRLSQDKDVQVYFLYYKGTVQEQAMALMGSKLKASMAIEGKFSDEGLAAMSNNDDTLTRIASSVAEGIKETVDAQIFSNNRKVNTKSVIQARKYVPKDMKNIAPLYPFKKKHNKRMLDNAGFSMIDDQASLLSVI